jgi:aminopeptidase N
MAERGASAAAMASDLLTIFARRFATPYPYSKLDLVAVPAFAAGAMENAGLVTFREELLLVDAKSSTRARRHALQLMAHELAHQWFGDLVTLWWWDDLWLNEGSASYFEGLAADEWRPETHAELEDLLSLGSVMALDGLDSARRVREPVRTVYEAEEAFDAITYTKGSAILGMLHSYLGDGSFRRGIGLFLSRNAHGNASARELFEALGEAGRIDVAGVASTFVDQPGVPLVSIARSCEDGRGRLTLEQRRHRLTERASVEGRWRIPMCLRYDIEGPSASATGAPRRACTLLVETKQELVLDGCPTWLAPNEDHRGYYRYAMTSDDLRRLWRASSADVRARVGFLGNAWGLVQSGDLELVEFLDYLEEAAGSRDLETTTVVVEFVDRIALTVVDEASRASFSRWVSGVFGPAAKELGWDARRGEREETPLVRELVLEVLGAHAGERVTRDDASRRANAYLRSVTSVSPDIAGIALRLAARQRTVGFDGLMRSLAADSTPEHRIRVLRALGSLGEPAELERALDLIVSGAIRPSDGPYIVRAAASTEAGRAILSPWLEAKFGALAERTDAMSASSYLTSYARACSEAERSRVAGHFGPVVSQLGGSSRRLSEVLEAIGACVELRTRQASAARAWFAAWKSGGQAQ